MDRPNFYEIGRLLRQIDGLLAENARLRALVPPRAAPPPLFHWLGREVGE